MPGKSPWKVREGNTEDFQGSQKLIRKLLQLSGVFENCFCPHVLGCSNKAGDSQALVQNHCESDICLQPPQKSNGLYSFQISHVFFHWQNLTQINTGKGFLGNNRGVLEERGCAKLPRQWLVRILTRENCCVPNGTVILACTPSVWGFW